MRLVQEENRTELTTLLEDEGLTDVPLLVFANKQDLVNAMPAEEVFTMRVGCDRCQCAESPIIRTCRLHKVSS